MNMEEASPHDIAGLTKLYFRELPDPLFTFELYVFVVGITKLMVLLGTIVS